jgi:hypothetical protein
MKNLLIASSVFIAFSGIANAFQVQTRCQFNPFHGECSVVNDSYNMASCQLQIQGRTFSGAFYTGHENVILYPGQSAYAYVNANNGQIDPLVYVSGFANCQTIY